MQKSYDTKHSRNIIGHKHLQQNYNKKMYRKRKGVKTLFNSYRKNTISIQKVLEMGSTKRRLVNCVTKHYISRSASIDFNPLFPHIQNYQQMDKNRLLFKV